MITGLTTLIQMINDPITTKFHNDTFSYFDSIRKNMTWFVLLI